MQILSSLTKSRFVRYVRFRGALRDAVLLWPFLAALACSFAGTMLGAAVVLVFGLMTLLLGRWYGAQSALLGRTDAGPREDRLIQMLNIGLADMARTAQGMGCLVLRMDDARRFAELNGTAFLAQVLCKSAERFVGALREGDIVAALPNGAFGIGLRPGGRVDIETMIQLAARLQATTAVGVEVNGKPCHITFSAGFCLGTRTPLRTGPALLHAAATAAHEAALHGPAAIRAYSSDMATRQIDRLALANSLACAFENGEIQAYFQPQMSTDTGQITGFEALVRWQHPVLGLLCPADFLPVIEAEGKSEQLAEVMLAGSLAALVAWDAAGIKVPSVGINFSTADLRNPKLVENLKWELDRFELAPSRVAVEILETVMADTDSDVSVRNIAALAKLGCGIDLDDFGTGNASITGIRQFDVRRIKIDRSFVTRIDTDRTQQRMISALVSLADRLGLDTLAEGVETAAEHAMLAQLGCRHVQGFGIARPMPFNETVAWLRAQNAKLITTPRIGSRAVGG